MTKCCIKINRIYNPKLRTWNWKKGCLMSGDQSSSGEPPGWLGNPTSHCGGGGTSAFNGTQSSRINAYFAGLPTVSVWHFLCPNYSIIRHWWINRDHALKVLRFTVYHLLCSPSSHSSSWYFRSQRASSWSQTQNVCIGGSCQGNKQDIADVTTAGMDFIHFETAFQVRLSQTARRPIHVFSFG